MEKEHIDEILNKMFEIKEEKGEKIVIFRDSKKKDVRNNRKRKSKSDLPNS